jgi:SAM-dependent methyltransferase
VTDAAAGEANAEQAEFWGSEEARHWIERQDAYDRMLAPFVAPVLDAAALAPDERVIDVGCGTGATTCAAAGRAHHALGVDISAPMIEAARRRAAAAGIGNVEFLAADAQVHPFTPGSGDVVISRFGVMFFSDPVAAFTNLARAVGDGGRAAFVCWQPMLHNEWLLVPLSAALEHLPAPTPPEPGAPGPFAFGDADHVHDILRAAGFGRVEIEPLTEPVLLGGADGIEDAVAFLRRTGMGRAMFAEAPDDQRDRALDAVRERLAPFLTREGVRLGSAAWLVSAFR